MGIGERIRSLRERQGMAQCDLAKASGISQANLSRIESERSNELRSDTVGRLAKALHVSTDCLIYADSKAARLSIENAPKLLKRLLQFYARLTPTGKLQLSAIASAMHEMEVAEGEGLYTRIGLRGNRNPHMALLRLAEALDNQLREEYEASDEYLDEISRFLADEEHRHSIEQQDALQHELYESGEYARMATEDEAHSQHPNPITLPSDDDSDV